MFWVPVQLLCLDHIGTCVIILIHYDGVIELKYFNTTNNMHNGFQSTGVQ